MTKIISQKKVYAIGNSFYVLIPKEVRDDAEISSETMYNMTYDPKTRNMKIKFLKGV